MIFINECGMSEKDKIAAYQLLLKQIETLIENEIEPIGVLANVSSAIHQTFADFFWTGFYLLQDKTLRLGPFQGTLACYSIPVGRGVCGTAVAENRTIVVPDVELFPGHIACSSLSRSEIVVPLHDGNQKVVAVLDIDSTNLSTFDSTDQLWLEKIVELVARQLYPY